MDASPFSRWGDGAYRIGLQRVCDRQDFIELPEFVNHEVRRSAIMRFILFGRTVGIRLMPRTANIERWQTSHPFPFRSQLRREETLRTRVCPNCTRRPKHASAVGLISPRYQDDL